MIGLLTLLNIKINYKGGFFKLSNRKVWLYIIGFIVIILAAVILRVFFEIKGNVALLIFIILILGWGSLFQRELIKLVNRRK